MNKYIRKLGFRASDEMEMEVTIKSIRFAWLYVMLFLIGWGILHAIDKSEIPMVQLALVFTAELLYFALQWWFTKKAVNENKAEHHAIKTLKAKGRGKSSYEYIYEDEQPAVPSSVLPVFFYSLLLFCGTIDCCKPFISSAIK